MKAWMLALPFAAAGLPLVVFGAKFLKQRVVARWRGLLVEGEVIRCEHHARRENLRIGGIRHGSSTVTPIFKYLTPEGEQLTAKLDHQVRRRLRSERSRLRFPVGAKMLIRIDPDRPAVAYDDSLGWMIVLPSLMIFAGTLATLLALGIFFGAEDSPPAQPPRATSTQDPTP